MWHYSDHDGVDALRDRPGPCPEVGEFSDLVLFCDGCEQPDPSSQAVLLGMLVVSASLSEDCFAYLGPGIRVCLRNAFAKVLNVLLVGFRVFWVLLRRELEEVIQGSAGVSAEKDLIGSKTSGFADSSVDCEDCLREEVFPRGLIILVHQSS